MRRTLRLCLLFLISLALPLGGMAGAEMPADPCPMKSAGMAKMADMQPDCCHDMAEHGKKACKTGQECKTASMLQVGIAKPAVMPSNLVPAVSCRDHFPSQLPPDPWRPPRSRS
ncbi:hypothetical protein [Azotobacter salinestris]|uniref:hypothetical protein n=1 Tax=Azotobacter salinestris TaxID=69964 RepID=UPI001266A6A8|nr:hypothetical protein [Azotobacter salinestris]